MRKTKSLRQDLRDGIAAQRFDGATGHAWGVSAAELDRQWREWLTEGPREIAERALAFRRGELDPREHRTGLDTEAKAVLAVADAGGDWSAVPQWIVEEREWRRGGLTLIEGEEELDAPS